MVLEAQIREEVSSEFMELFNKMEKDYRWVIMWCVCLCAHRGR